MGKRTKLSGPEIFSGLSVVRCDALIGCTLSVVRESVGGMLGVGVCVVAPDTGISVNTVPYRTLAIFYGILPGRVPHGTYLLALTCTMGVLYGMLMGGIGVCTFWCRGLRAVLYGWYGAVW